MHLRDFELERYFARHEFEVPYVLCASDCETLSIDELLSLEPGAEAGLHGLRLGYTESSGHPALREQISALYDTVPAGNVLVFSGAEEAIFAFMHTALVPRSAVAVTFPGYQSLYGVAESIGARVVKLELRESDGWALPLGAVESALRQGARVIVVNFPHNPTGAQLDLSSFTAVRDMAQAHGAVVFSDEVYRLGEFTASERLPAMCDLYERGVSLGVMSKPLGLAGLRIGWIATHDEELLRRLRSFKDYTTICAGAASEFLAALALRHRERILSRNLDLIRDNVLVFERFLRRRPTVFSWTPPQAGPIAFPRLLGGRGAEALCDELAREAGVLLLPSTVFHYGDRHVRIGLGRKDFPQGLERLEAHLASG